MHVEKNNKVWQTAVTCVTLWHREHEVLEGSPDRQVRRFLTSFAENFNHFVTQYPEINSFTRQELVLLFAAIFLYDERALVSWEQICQRLVILIPDGQEMADEACLDLVVAFGCGWHREVVVGNENWEGRWYRAILALRVLVEGSLHQTYKLISSLLSDKLALFSGSMKEWTCLYSDVIALELLHDKCRCGKHQQECKKTGDGHACGRECCRNEHRLSSWRPEVCSLQAFVAHAVRGNASNQLKTGALITSMLYPLLNEDNGLTIDSVEFKVCGKCSDAAVLKSIAQHKEPKSQGSIMFESNTCPACNTPANRQTTYHKARKNWILIPYEFGGAYEMLDRWRCPRCRNLFPINMTACPLCASSTPQRKTTIWVYSPWLRSKDGEED